MVLKVIPFPWLCFWFITLVVLFNNLLLVFYVNMSFGLLMRYITKSS